MNRTARSPLATPEIEAIWIDAAARLGFRVERTEDAYASTDGAGTLLVGEPGSLDVDDALAQLVFHELCHALVEGPPAWRLPDWGLENVPGPRGAARDVVREHACLRVQAHLGAPAGLRGLMAPTTEYRAYHDALGADTLAPEQDPAAALARAALARAATRGFVAVLADALAATRAALGAEAGGAEPHPLGFALAGDAARGESCGTCAWRYVGGRGRGVERCRQSAGADGDGRRTESSHPACVRWEAPVDCRSCGACCREAYHSVTVAVRDPVVWKQPHLIVRNGHRFEIRREGERCAALEHDGPAGRRGGPALRVFSCSIYEDRPRACRDFEAGGRHCLVARRRVGLSP
jgi:hypothetical protein